MRRRILFAVLVGLLAAGTAQDSAAADEEALGRDVAELLEMAWATPFRSLDATQAKFDEIQAAAPGDRRALLAFTLIQLKHRRYEEGIRFSRQTVAADPKSFVARRALAWTLVLMKDYPAALVEMESLAELVAESGTAEEQADSREESARFLGRMFGFLEGPAESAVDGQLVADHRERIGEHIFPAYEEVFGAGRKAVLDRFDELALDQDQLREDAKAEQEKVKDRIAERLEKQRGDAAAEKRSLAKRLSQAQKALETVVETIDGQLGPLDEAFAKLSAEAMPLQKSMQDLDQRIGRLLTLADEADSPYERDDLLNEADRLTARLDRYQQSYGTLDAEATQINTQRQALRIQRETAEGRYAAEAKDISRRGGQLRKIEKRIESDLSKADRPATGTNPRVRAAATNANAFTTYEKFPLDREKERLLKSFR